jgi:AcrR family transcriptional regulator
MAFSCQEAALGHGRVNQKIRTRRALLDAAIRLVRQGRSPTVAEVAEAALVSVPTVYRYFSSPEDLWAEVARNLDEPDPKDAFAGVAPDDAAGRVEAVVTTVGWRQFEDEAMWRNLARVSLQRWFAQADVPEAERVPIRGERRMLWVSEALEPLKAELDEASLRRLESALAVVFGMDAMIALRDTCRLDRDEAKEVMLWSAKALVAAALAEGKRGAGTRRGTRRSSPSPTSSG